jgi:hypothetical protein
MKLAEAVKRVPTANLLVIGAAACLVIGAGGLLGPFVALLVTGLLLGGMAWALETQREPEDRTREAIAEALEAARSVFEREKAEALGELEQRHALEQDERIWREMQTWTRKDQPAG